ncbi:hypothetical protein Mnod_7650 [Methylobacterium nodulans ORS 2060]|uniref:DUF4113 domain-containing protein n=1 Tax=Methylobacterium nodulans (strain LMG 21967 / CNCM I-2342 / ORS 2060) TaxID=460265 RepID=B8IQT5_METNO|nr:hypothetical protein Mnod_7650 [Methylobacterium nodulans ORS 2060]
MVQHLVALAPTLVVSAFFLVFTLNWRREATWPRAITCAIGLAVACNARFGRGAVVPARAGLVDKRTWSTRFEMRTPRYTTRPDELPVVNAVPV